MPGVCKKCGNTFPYRVCIEGKVRVLSSRKYCLNCSPFGVHNTNRLHEEEEQDGRFVKLPERKVDCRCEDCGKHYVYDRDAPRGNHGLKLCGACRARQNRKRVKAQAIEYKGGKCQICGYSRCWRSLQFHHLDPSTKKLRISGRQGWGAVKKELDKCILVCANCHGEIEDGLIATESLAQWLEHPDVARRIRVRSS